MDQITVDTAAVVVLAEGTSTSEISNKRGHLFEKFIAKLLATQGYSDPHPENLNPTSEGIELDVRARNIVTGEQLICECKAYSSNVRVPPLMTFIGKFSLAQAKDKQTKGLFIALPRLTPEAKEQAELAEATFPGFRYLGSYEICELLQAADVLPRWEDGPEIRSDPTVVITEHGVVLAACELDSDTRGGSRWVTWARNKDVPLPIVRLIEKNLSKGLPVVRAGHEAGAVPIHVPSLPKIVEVQGSTSDFEYQLPAAPEFFIGRKTLAQSLLEKMKGRLTAGSVVINAKSGWGKSSLVLHLQKEVEKVGGVGMVFDSRTAERSDFVAAAMERTIRKAVEREVIELPSQTAFSSLQSIVETLKRATWASPARPIFLAFDQFENVFRNTDLTREFRDLTYLIREISAPLTISFSWKTDVVAWTEGYPFGLRNDIRDASSVFDLDPFGPREIEALLRRLEKSLGSKLNRELRQRLREYNSQGLPWLFKKFGAHIIAEVARGIKQDDLAKQALNARGLFESDLARLNPSEQSLLRTIAQAAPVVLSDLDYDATTSTVLDSLLHQRLVVQVGHTIDVYWDTFRDYLNNGSVAIEDSYVVRYAPLGAGRLLRVVVAEGGSISVPDAATRLDTTPTVIFNYSRELRQFGVLTSESNRVTLEADLMNSSDKEEAIRARVSQALRRHKMYKLAADMIAREGTVSIHQFASTLSGEFRAVSAKSDSWVTYARSFCQWMEYAGLVRLLSNGMERPSENDSEPLGRLLSGSVPVRVRSPFPNANPGPALQLLMHLFDPTGHARPSRNGFATGVRDLTTLGLVETDDGERITLSDSTVFSHGAIEPKRLRAIVERQRGISEAFAALEANPGLSPLSLGIAHRDTLGAEWAESTTLSAGKYIRAWARACGISTQLRSTT
ncbi:nSTAND1 domain-containing NTPase [Saccharothrix syringae]|uniref:nSTAND1 domain-containing NTPase n=1 Tax=Saccharothrix syringae TaxID=103733 RepID=UPI001477883A|nr:restriction endonuclease [Saccharothrix syringae]